MASAVALRTMKQGIAYLGCNVHLTGPSGRQCDLLVLVHTDQPFRWDIQEGGICKKLGENGSIIYINWC